MEVLIRKLVIANLALITCALVGPAAAEPSPPITIQDAQQLPAFRGTVAQYTLSPRGDVDGLILTDGTEVHLPPHLSTALVFAVKPGDAVTVRGLRAYSIPMIAAVGVTNDASGQNVIDTGPSGSAPGAPGELMSVQGRIKSALHGPGGEINGAVLDDGTILRLPPQAQRFAVLLLPGQNVAAQGDGLTTPMGRVLDVRALGPSPADLNGIRLPFAHPAPSGLPRP
ncbi:hypothetical protein [Rhizobium mesoamericanum]|uniref:hypothetical protein n=1 Tax=Rhizobium mesoamericanum TaxID=1079800 RepID=UPI000404786E|nr:hypothetical protein [Rhizobium mesoamericanum]